jgi:hypothetical protein
MSTPDSAKTSQVGQLLEELLDDKFSDNEAKTAFDNAANAYQAKRESLKSGQRQRFGAAQLIQRLERLERRLAAVETALGITPEVN